MCTNFALRVLITLSALRDQAGVDAGDVGDYVAEMWPECIQGPGPAAYQVLYGAVEQVLRILGA